MDTQVRNIIEEVTKGSDEERITFPEVVMKLVAAGVERYHSDLVRAEKTYYMPNGDSHTMKAMVIDENPGREFSAPAVEAAVRAIQAKKLTDKAFCESIARAGCVGYFVSLVGRRAVYYGRTGDNYVEPFPAAK